MDTMLPLEMNKLNNSEEWHLLKNLLLTLKYLSKEEALEKYEKLPKPLKESFVAKEACKFMETNEPDTLDNAAEFLTQSRLPDAWLYIERL